MGIYNLGAMRRLWWCSVLLLGATMTYGSRLSFQEHAAVQESLARVHPRMRASWLRQHGIDDPYYTAVRRPDSGQGLREVGRWSYGPSYDVDGRVTPSETLVALARGSGVSLLRFSRQDSLSIELLSDINAEGLMCRVKVLDTLLYVGSRKGLEIYDIANEQSPVRLSWTPLPLNDFDVQDSLVYTISGYWTDSGGDDSFRIYNISNPANPVFRGACRDSGHLVSVEGNTAFVGDRWGLYVIDVTNPSSPHRIGSWGSRIEQVEARGHLCYVTTGSSEPGDITFRILDVTVPSLPYQIGSLDSAGGRDLFLVDTLAFGAGEENFNKLTIVSIADSTRPKLIGQAPAWGWSCGIWTSGLTQATFLGCHWEGLQVYDTRNTSLPVRDAFLLGADMAVDICIDNGRAYVADEKSGLKMLDVSDPRKPTTLGSLDLPGQVPFMSSVVARDSFAFVEWFVSPPPLRTVDVTNPSQPELLGGANLFNPPEAMVLRDSFVYVVEIVRFQIVNVARPREPVLVGSCLSTDGTYFGLVVQDTLAYVAGGAELEVISVADPSDPYVIGNGGRPSMGVAIRDTFAYIPYPYDTLFVYSVADPTEVRMLSATPAGVWPSDVALGESKAYVSSVDGVDIYDLDSPAQPIHRGRAGSAEPVLRITYADGLLYAAMQEAGVAIYETTAVGISESSQVASVGRTQLCIVPNPVCSQARIFGASVNAQVAVYDAVGRTVGVEPAKQEGGVIDLNTVELRSGVYFVEVKEKSATTVLRIVKP